MTDNPIHLHVHFNKNLLRCNEQPQFIQHEQYSRTFHHIVEAQSVPALQKQPPTQPPPQPPPQQPQQPAPQLAPQPPPQPASQPASQPAPQPASRQLHNQSTNSSAPTAPYPSLQPAPQPAPQQAPQPASQPALQQSVQHIQNQQCTQHTQPPQVPYASCRSTPDHQAPLYQPSPALYTQYKPVQAPLTHSTLQNEHYQDIGLLTEFEQYQNGHLQNEQYPDIRDGHLQNEQ